MNTFLHSRHHRHNLVIVPDHGNVLFAARIEIEGLNAFCVGVERVHAVAFDAVRRRSVAKSA